MSNTYSDEQGVRIMSKLISGGYTPPTSDEVRDILRKMGLTGEMAGELVACSSRQIRRYTSEGNDRSSMPYAILFTLAYRHSGCVLTPGNWREALVIQPKEADSIKGIKV